MRRLAVFLLLAACAHRAAPPVIANDLPADSCAAIRPALARAQMPVTGARSRALEAALADTLERTCREDGWSAQTIACAIVPPVGRDACRHRLPAGDRAAFDEGLIEAQRAIAATM